LATGRIAIPHDGKWTRPLRALAALRSLQMSQITQLSVRPSTPINNALNMNLPCALLTWMKLTAGQHLYILATFHMGI